MTGRRRRDEITATFSPRAMRLPQAAYYLSMSETSFLRLVDDKQMPRPVKIKGMTVWDRLDLDAAFDDIKLGSARKSRNSMHALLGITDSEDD